MENFSLAEETLGYVTSQDPSNTDKRLLVGGSKNVQIDFQRKTKIRSGYTRLGAANTALTPVRNAWTWHTSTGTTLPQRFYDDELEVYLRTIDGVDINAWKRVRDSWSTTERLRAATHFDTTENLDLQVMVQGDDNLYAWNGAVAVVASVTGSTITKDGTDTFAQARFFTSSNRTLVNIRTGTEFSYTGGESTLTLTGVTGDPTADGMVAGDILVQKVVTTANTPATDRNNHTIGDFENQIIVGSEDDEEVYISKNNDYTDYTFSSPRVAGEGALLTLSDPNTAIASLGPRLLFFSGRSTVYQAEYLQIAVSTTLAETLQIKKLEVGVDQSALNQESVVPIGNSLAFLSNEVALRIIENPEDLEGINPKTFSNPIKPDFDAESWFDSDGKPDAFGFWNKNILYFTAPQASRMYMLNFVESADGKLLRYWNPPQTLPVGAMSVIDSGTGNDLSNGDRLHGHSDAVPETYLLFDGASDGQYSGMAVADKLPIDAKAVYAYDNDGHRAILKNFDEYYVEGEITTNTSDLTLTIDYDFDGATQSVEETIDGSDEDILEGSVQINSLAQQSLAVNPLGGLLNPPSDARRFRVVFEQAKEDYFEKQATFSTNEVDRFWSIIAHGSNAELSKRKATTIRK